MNFVSLIHLNYLIIKNLIIPLILILISSFKIKAQNSTAPKFFMPVMKGTEEYDNTFYSLNKEYYCEEWLKTYMQLYHSNRTPEKSIMRPTTKYDVLKDISQKHNSAKLLFELYYPQVFIENTPSYVVEELLEESPDYDLIYKYTTEEELLITGLMIPYNFEIGETIPIEVENPDVLFKYVDKVEFISARYGSGQGGSGNAPIATLSTGNPQINIDPKELEHVSLKVFLLNGNIYYFSYNHRDCFVDPIVLEPVPIPPPPPPVSDPPVIPELDIDCNIKPTYFNNPFTGGGYVAQFPYEDPNPVEFQQVWTMSIEIQNGQNVTVWGWQDVPIPHPYTSSVNKAVYGTYGKINTAVYLNPYHDKVVKPIIVTDGIDFLSNRTWKEIVEHLGGNEMISLLWDGGYDVIIADFAGGADFIQRNSFALIELIRSLRHEQQVEKIEAIIGPSMGGQIIRHALLYWENYLQSDPNYGDHGINLFLSADSPWTGANASPAVQGIARLNKDGSSTMLTIDKSANSPAACQLLLNQIDGMSLFSGSLYAPFEHKFKTSFDNEIVEMGSFPLNINKLIAIADGSGNGATSNVKPGELILEMKFETCNSWYLSECLFTNSLLGVNSNDELISKSCETLSGLGWFSCDPACESFYQINTLQNNRFFDSCPASPFNLNDYLSGMKVGMEVYKDKGFLLKIKEIETGESFSFIPTFSALGMPTSSFASDFFQSIVETPFGYILPGSPFDYVYFDDTDSKHNSFSVQEQPGSLSFLLTNLDYKKIYETKCIVDENISNPSQTFNVEQGGFGSEQSFCIPFKYSSYYVNGSNDCEISLLTNEGSNEYYLQSDLIDEWCVDELEICFETECGKKCIFVEVVTYPAGNKIMSQTETEKLDEEIIVFPNPNNGTFEINKNLDDQVIEISNLLGEKIPFEVVDNKIIIKPPLNHNLLILNLKNEKNKKTNLTTKVIIVK